MPLSNIPISSLAAILKQVSDGYYAVDRSLRVTDVDPRIEQVSAMSPEASGTLLFNLFPALRGSIFEVGIRRAMATGVPAHFESASLLDARRWIDVQAVPYREGLIIMFRDITHDPFCAQIGTS